MLSTWKEALESQASGPLLESGWQEAMGFGAPGGSCSVQGHGQEAVLLVQKNPVILLKLRTQGRKGP